MSPNAQETRGQWRTLRNLKEGPLGAETQTFQEGLKWCSWMEDKMWLILQLLAKMRTAFSCCYRNSCCLQGEEMQQWCSQEHKQTGSPCKADRKEQVSLSSRLESLLWYLLLAEPNRKTVDRAEMQWSESQLHNQQAGCREGVEVKRQWLIIAGDYISTFYEERTYILTSFPKGYVTSK